MENGIIRLDSQTGVELGFTSDKFAPSSYLWIREETVIISFIESLAKGNFRGLVGTIIKKGFAVEVPNPLENMERIVEKCGYRHELRNDEYMGVIDVWVLDPPKGRSESKKIVDDCCVHLDILSEKVNSTFCVGTGI